MQEGRGSVFFIFSLGSWCVNGFSHVPSGGVAVWVKLKVIVTQSYSVPTVMSCWNDCICTFALLSTVSGDKRCKMYKNGTCAKVHVYMFTI